MPRNNKGENYSKTLWQWCEFKKRISEGIVKKRLYIKKAELWWVSMGINIGVEMDGKGKEYARPVLVLKVYSKSSALIVPLTSKDKTGSKHHVLIGDVKGKKAFAVLSQARAVDTRRFQERIKKISDRKFREFMDSFTKYNNFCDT